MGSVDNLKKIIAKTQYIIKLELCLTHTKKYKEKIKNVVVVFCITSLHTNTK